jgi:hypothetical protein
MGTLALMKTSFGCFFSPNPRFDTFSSSSPYHCIHGHINASCDTESDIWSISPSVVESPHDASGLLIREDMEDIKPILDIPHRSQSRVPMFTADDPAVILPDDVAQSDCIKLSRLFMASLKDPQSTFTIQSLTTMRQWAKARHLYGTQFGYPGGSAWATMLWAYTQWLDYASLVDETMSVTEVLRCFFVIVSIWPWPLPFSYNNMGAVVAGTKVDGTALQGSVGRYQTTAFVVPQPCGRKGWNMTPLVEL